MKTGVVFCSKEKDRVIKKNFIILPTLQAANIPKITKTDCFSVPVKYAFNVRLKKR